MTAPNTDLRSLLARLYPDPELARRVVGDADLDGRRIDFSGSVDLVWFRVLAEAEKHGPAALYRLRHVAWSEYPEALEEPNAPPARREEPLGAYLEWAWRHHRVLRVLGYQNRERIQLTLDHVFVDLSVEAGRPRPDREPLWRLHSEGKGDETAFEQSELMNLASALRLAEHRDKVGLVLLGDPGAGKTTLLKHLLCRAIGEGTEALGMPPRLVPVLLRFSQLRTGTGGDLVARGLLKVLRRELGALGYEAAGERLATGDLPVLFLLDGLDEVRDEAARVAVCQWLDDEVAHFSGSRFVGTCRFAAWQREARLHNQFLTAHVQWLDRDKVRTFVDRWYEAVEVGQGGTIERAQERAASLLAALLGGEREADYRLREMTRNPLLLSVLCLVHYSGDRLPESRAKLYDVCISFLLETWAGQREGRPGLPDAAARQVLQPLAWTMHEQSAKTFSAPEVRAALAEPFGQVQGLGLTLDEFLRRARDDCGLLTGSDVDSYEFLHLSFQEYLAAAHARDNGEAGALADHLDEPFWRETILLAMSMQGIFVPFMRRLVERGALGAHQQLIAECFSQTTRLDPAPFLPVLEPETADAPPRSPEQLAEVGVVLELFRGRASEAIVTHARAFADHSDPAVRAVAREVAGIVKERRVTFEAAAGAPEVTARASVGLQATRVSAVAGLAKTAEPTSAHVAGGDASSVPGPTLPPTVAGIEWLWVPPGTFLMGSSKTPGEPGYDAEAYDDETPAHRVTLTQGFAMARHPVTNETYARFLGAVGHREPSRWNDRRFNQPAQPIVGVSWHDARAFCEWLTREVPDGWTADLPTEAQWEYAARGSDARKYPWGSEAPNPKLAVYGLPSDKGPTAPVGERPLGRSPWSIEDMAGNVWEWCLDVWSDKYVDTSGSVSDPCQQGASSSPRVVRGGSWHGDPRDLRCAYRGRHDPGDRLRVLGFRVVCGCFREHVDT